LSQQWKY